MAFLRVRPEREGGLPLGILAGRQETRFGFSLECWLRGTRERMETVPGEKWLSGLLFPGGFLTMTMQT